MCKVPIPEWGKEVKKVLIDKDMSVTDLANELGLTREYVSKILNGSVRGGDVKTRILERLGLS